MHITYALTGKEEGQLLRDSITFSREMLDESEKSLAKSLKQIIDVWVRQIYLQRKDREKVAEEKLYA